MTRPSDPGAYDGMVISKSIRNFGIIAQCVIRE
jgi:hypothetical protein